MRLRTPISLAIFALFLSGCALQPTYQRPDSPVATSYPQGATYPAKAGSGPVSPAAAGIAWRDNFRDPRLQRLVELALQNNRDLRVAILNIEKVKAQYQIQRASLFPQVNIASSGGGKNPGATGAAGGNAGTSHSYAADLSVSWEADFFGHLHNLSDAAFEQYIASSYARKATEILLVSQVVDQYLAVLAYGEQRDVTQQLLQTAQASYKLAKLQFDVGTLSELDLRLSQTAVEQAQANYAAQTRLQAQAGNALVLLVGQPLPADLPAPAKLRDQSILADIPPGLPSDLLENRPDILQAEAILRSENANIGAARAAFFPQIALTGSLGTASSSLGGLFAAGSGAWSFLPALLAPIFDAGANRANLDVAKVQKDIGIAQYQKAVQTAFREVSDGLAARATYDEQLAAQQRYTNAQARRLELENMLYAAGSDSYLNVLLAQNDLYNAQQSLITTQLNRLTSLADLYRSLGGGWKADAAPVRQNTTGSTVATEGMLEMPSRTGS
ncbi:efflux transporter outer membrane subunit [Undibacterium terreum]|uniref:Multidrug transporter n=1 Tax=Undibacterium terreum TaxID=1224302 RepID=A0A916U2X0_9BURK|nr:efflux transporter outer membrane subunit [Undibacterium terreum]GGC57341.1 multidrug transporter [Undibacterium terreum]